MRSDRLHLPRALTTTAGTPSAQRRRARTASSKERPALPAPDPIRRPFSTRDLADAQACVQRELQLTGLEDLGQATSHGGRHLICDLTSPIAVGSEPRYRLGPPGIERSSADRLFAYRWTLRRRADGRPIWQTLTAVPEVRIAAAAPGRYLVEGAVLADGAPTGVRLWLAQDVELEPRDLATGLEGTGPAVAAAMRELINELRPYILEAAAATGDRGITARCLAAAMFIEILSRPKAARERELDDLDALFDALERGDRILLPSGALDRPLGVGQLRPMTAAMVMGAAPWIDQDRSDRRPARDRIKAGFDALPLETKRAIFTQLRWPKSNVAMAARLLCALKNRPHRYPALTRAQLAADPHAVGIVATEYVSGATSTPAADATSSGYGYWVWHQMQESLVQRFFPDD
jgi:hypothetical protein